MRPANILHLGIKELRSLMRDPIMLVLIVYAFTISVYTAATAMPETLNKAPIAVVNEDRSPLSQRLIRLTHARLMQGVRGRNKAPGEYRRIPNWIGPEGCTIEAARFIPCSAERLPMLTGFLAL